MLQPKVGDTVVCEFEVTCVQSDFFKYKRLDGALSTFINKIFITEIKPASFKVGDNVWWVARENSYGAASYLGSTLLYIHNVDGRKFAVVAYEGDIPKSVWFKDLRRSHSECVG